MGGGRGGREREGGREGGREGRKGGRKGWGGRGREGGREEERDRQTDCVSACLKEKKDIYWLTHSKNVMKMAWKERRELSNLNLN